MKKLSKSRGRWARYALVAIATAMVIAPVAAYAADAFNDVPDTNIFHDDIAWMADNGITFGCGSGNFCPSAPVTREQMSAFMKRLAENQVVDAATALEADHATTADSATTADDADTLDGLNSTDLVAKGEADSVDSTMISNEAGAASASVDSGDITGTLGPVVSVTLTVPSAGYIIAYSDMQLNLNHSTGTTSQTTMGLSTSATAFGQNHQDNAIGVPSGAASGFYFQSPALTGVFPVAAAGNITIHLLAVEDSGTVSFNDATLSAIFVPTAYGDVTTASISDGEDPAN